MKRIKITLIAAAILGVGSAFATTALPNQWVKLGANNYVNKDTYFASHPTAQCVAQVQQICAYIPKPGATMPYSDSEVQPDTQANQGTNWRFIP